MHRDIQLNSSSRLITVSERVSLRVLSFNRFMPDAVSAAAPAAASASKGIYPELRPLKLLYPVIFIPGWISHLKSWLEFLPVLTAGSSVYYMDTREKPSAGLSKDIFKYNGEFSIEKHTNDLEAVINALGLQDKKFYLAGSSMGANIILRYLVQGKKHPIAAAALIPNLDFKIPKWGVPFLYLPARIYYLIRPVIKSYLYLFKSDRGSEKSMLNYIFYGLDAAEPERLQASARDMQNYTLPDKLERVNTPCLLVGSRLDRMHLSSIVRKISNKIPNSKYLEIDASGETHTAGMAEIIIEYFKRYG
ncbi:MAG: alpha/beta hydrolase [Spirochaetes bacterium]|nr:alpha/beta hydrolase [Spirochaetota bacterium]